MAAYWPTKSINAKKENNEANIQPYIVVIFSHLDQPSLGKGPFARSGHMVRKTLCWNASYTADFPNKGKSGWTGPTGLLAFQHKLFRSMGPIWDLLYGTMTLFSCG